MKLRHKTTGVVITIPENGSYEHLTSFEIVKDAPKPKAAPKTRSRAKKAEVDDGKGD